MTQPTSAARANFSWRNIDIIITAVIGVVVGLIFVTWNIIGDAGYEAVNAPIPGLGGLVVGTWFLGSSLDVYIIREPGIVIFAEVTAATVSALIGNQWGITTLYSGLAQGLGAKLVFFILAYKGYNFATVVISGLMAGVGAWTFELFIGNLAKTFEFNATYLISSALSGVVFAGLLVYLLAKTLAATGALDRLAIGRERHDDVRENRWQMRR